MDEGQRLGLIAKARAALAIMGEVLAALEGPGPGRIDPADDWAADLLEAIGVIYGGTVFTAADLIAVAGLERCGERLQAVLATDRSDWSSKALGKRLAALARRNFRGLELCSDSGENGAKLWCVRPWVSPG